LKKSEYDNEDLLGQLIATQETQKELTQELMALQEHCAEVRAMLDEAQTELVDLRNRKSVM